jgi:hypothetical protein
MNITTPFGNCLKSLLLPLALMWNIGGCGHSDSDGTAEKCFSDDNTEDWGETDSLQLDLQEDSASFEAAGTAQDEPQVISPEPNGLSQLLISEGFDNCAFSPGWNGSYIWWDSYPQGESPFVQMQGHGCVMQVFIPAGVDDISSVDVGLQGDEAFAQVTGSPNVDEFYIEWQEYYPDDHDFADGAQKMMRFTYWKSDEPGGAVINLMAMSNNQDLQLSLSHPDGGNGQPIDLFTNTGLSIPTDRWVTFGVWCRLNTPGEQDGFAYAYMDGEQIVRMENISNRGSDSRGFNQMWIGGNHTNWGQTTQSSRRFVDNVRWYSTKP